MSTTADARPRFEGEPVTDWGVGLTLEQLSQRARVQEVFGRVTCIEDLAALVDAADGLIDNALQNFSSDYEHGTGPFQGIDVRNHLQWFTVDSICEKVAGEILSTQKEIRVQGVNTLRRLYPEKEGGYRRIIKANVEEEIKYTLLLWWTEAFAQEN